MDRLTYLLTYLLTFLLYLATGELSVRSFLVAELIFTWQRANFHSFLFRGEAYLYLAKGELPVRSFLGAELSLPGNGRTCS